MKLPVAQIVEDRAHLYLWVPDRVVWKRPVVFP